jgi:rhamnogalacturonan endolyase
MNPIIVSIQRTHLATKAALLGVLLTLSGLFMPASAFAAFGYTDNGPAYVVDTGAGLVFQVRKTDGTITSIVFNGTEYIGPSGKGSHIASGLGTPTTVTPETDGSTYVKVTLQTGASNGVVSSLTHYLVVKNGVNTIYMATYTTAEPNVGELRWITRLNPALIPNGPAPSDLDGNTGAIESSDVFGLPDGTTRSKYYGDAATRGKDRAMDLTYCGATGPGIGCWMVFGNRESSSGGPFFRDIENQQGGDQEIYNYMNSGHNQTEATRQNVLHGPYALVFTTGAAPTLPIDFSWMGGLGLTGWVPASGRGTVSGAATGIPDGFQGVVGFANSTAQYWAVLAADGSYTCAGVKPGTYTATLYKGELGVASDTVTVAAGATTTLDLVSTEPAPSVVFRIGAWDGTPAGLLNGDKIVQMHPQDVRMSPWDTTTFRVGIDDPGTFPAIQFRGANSPTTITFTLAPNQIVDLTARIGITCAYNNGRPQITVNNFTSAAPAAFSQPSSRSFTIGTYRGNNALFTYTIPASALVVGTNTMTINPISGSTDLGTWLSAGWVYDAVELDGPIAAPTIDYVGSDPLLIGGTAEPGRTITLTLDGSISAGSAVASASGAWTITYAAALSSGSHSFTVVASDEAGHSSPASAAYSFDSSLAMPVIGSAVGDTGTYTDGAATSDRVFSFNGTAGPGASVTLTRIGVGIIGTVMADGSGQWTVNYSSVSLPDGANRFYATASNGAGNSPSSPIFTLNLAGQPRISITRLNPAFPVIPNTVNSVVFRVTFNHPVSGVTAGAFAIAATDGAAGAVAGVSAASGTLFDVTVNAISGTGTLGIELRPDNGIVDGGGQPESGYTAGESYTLVVPTTGDGTWIRTDSGGRWSEALNWLNAVVADGDSHSADFGTLDLTATSSVRLDSPRTINSIRFGDTDIATPAGWLLDNNGNAANTLTLGGAAPTITVDELGSDASATIAASLAGTGGVTKAGDGPLVLTAANPLTGALNLTGGVLRIAPGGSLDLGSGAVNTALNTQLDIAGGAFSTDGLVSAVTSSVVVESGTAALGSFRTNSDFGGMLRASGGTLTVGDVNIGRNSGAAADFGSGFIVTGNAVATVATIGLGTKNSTGALSVEDHGSLTVTGVVTIANQATGGRGGAMRVIDDGTFTSTDSTFGVVLARTNGSNANNVASATFGGGVSSVEKFTLGFDATVTAGSATITLNGGTLYLGGGGIVKNGAAGLTTHLNFSSGTLGANANWSTALPINLPNGGNVVIKAANALDEPSDITLNGVLSGPGGLTKTGGGALTLAADNTFAGSVNLDAGLLRVTGALAAGGALNLNGGTLGGAGTIDKPVVLNAATLAPDNASSLVLGGTALTWNGGGRLAIGLGADGVSGQLTLAGALLKGTPGAYSIAFTPGSGFAAGNTSTIATFSSTTFNAGDFTATGLPPGYVAVFSLEGTSLQVTVKLAVGIGLSDLRQPYDGTPRIPVVTTDPAGLNVVFTYDGDATAPTLPGTYAVVATIDDPVFAGSASGTLEITITALVRHAPTFDGDIDGSVEVLLPEDVTLNGSSVVSGDLLVPGTPVVRRNGSGSVLAGIRDEAGAATPTNHTITLNGHSMLRYLVRRVDAITLPTVTAPQAPAGTRNVVLNTASQSAGNFATVRNLTLNGNAGLRVIPAGAYGDFTANGASGFILGVAGATEPAVYHLQHLTLNSSAALRVVGPVTIKLANGLSIDGLEAGSADRPDWLLLELSQGGVTLNSGATLSGEVIAPLGTVTLNDGATLNGRVSADRLILNGNVLLNEAIP